jgi:hypothetical protein
MVPSKIDSPIWGMITSVGMDSLSQLTHFLLILWAVGTRYVRPFFGGMAASSGFLVHTISKNALAAGRQACRELFILRQYHAYCVLLERQAAGDQIIEAFDPDYLPAEDPAKVPGYRVGNLLERRRWVYFSFDAGDAAVADATGNNQCEVVKIGGHVQGEAMGGDPAGNVDAQSGDLFLRDCTSGNGPDAGAPGRALGKHAEIRTGANEDLFQPA